MEPILTVIDDYDAIKIFDTEVPPRTAGRTTPHTEKWIFYKLLQALAKSDYFEYPITALHADKPDFILSTGSNQIGVEVTEAILQQFAAYSALAEREFTNALLQPGHFKLESPKRTPNELRGMLSENHISSDGWVNDSAEHEWSLAMSEVIKSKLDKLAKPGFQIYPLNWLCIYDNLPLCHIDLEKSTSILHADIDYCWLKIPGFSSIFIEHGHEVVSLRQCGISWMVINAL